MFSLILYDLKERKNIMNPTVIPSQQKHHFTFPESNIDIKFMSDQLENYLLSEAPEAPQLIRIRNSGGELQPFLRKGIVGQLVGAGGIGKTHWLAQLALSVATGATFLERYIIQHPSNVFIGLGENSDEDIHRLMHKTARGMAHRFQDWNKTFTDAAHRLAVMSFTGMHASFIHDHKATPFYNQLLESLKATEPIDGWGLIILDPISRFLGADAEKDNAAATRFIALLERFTLELKGRPTVLFGHHMGKSGVSSVNTDQTAARGSSALTDGVRWQANLDRVKKDQPDKDGNEYERDQIVFRVVKSNFTAIPDAHLLKKDSTGCLSCNDKTTNLHKSLSARNLK